MAARLRWSAYGALLAIALAYLGPIGVRTLVDAVDGSGIEWLQTSRVMVVILVAVLAADLGSRRLAELWVAPIDAFMSDIRKASAAVRSGRRSTWFFAPRSEPLEILEVRKATGQLVAAVESKRLHEHRVLGSAVHEVKAGLSGMAHTFDALAEIVPASDRPLFDRARQEARYLAAVMARLTEFLLSVQHVPMLGEVDLVAVARHTVARAQAKYPQRSIGLVAPQDVTVQGDKLLVERCISNLVENAARSARRVVEVAVFPGLVRVSDDGPGLPAALDVLSAAFESRTPATGRGQPIERSDDSMGLGLFIARTIVEAHEGNLTVERTGPDGTTILAYFGVLKERKDAL